jgi:hypothetical protein
MMDTKLKRSTSFHLQIEGQSEIVNYTMGQSEVVNYTVGQSEVVNYTLVQFY